MSHKRKPENIAFSVAITPDKKKKFENEDTGCVAVLAPFNPFPKVSFENVKLHSTAVQEVYLVNPGKNAIQVELTKLPDETRGYLWSATEFELPKESQEKLTINWTPTEYGSWHDSVKIVNKKTKKPLSELKLSSTTEEPPKVSKRRLRSRDVLTKKQNNSSKPEVMKKTSVIQTKSENKENELTFISKCKKQAQSRVYLQNENVTIYESKKSLQNRTFTQITENDLNDQSSSNIFEACVTQIASIHNSNKLEPLTPRRGTFNVIEPVMSRRSTYNLRNRQINIVDVKEEKKEFELLVKPSIHNESLEMAASRLINPNIKIEVSSVDEAEPLETSRCSATFTIQPSEIDNVPSLPSARVPSLQLLKVKSNERFSMESTASSEKFYDSLEERQDCDSLEKRLGSELEKNEASTGMRDSWVHWDEIYDIDKFSSISENLHTKTSFPNPCSKEEEDLNSLLEQRNILKISSCGAVVSEQAQASTSNFLNESYRNENRKPVNLSSIHFLHCSKEFDSLENVNSSKNLNQTKDTFLQLDEDFGKFNFSIVSSSPVNFQKTISNNSNRTFKPTFKSDSATKDIVEQSHSENTACYFYEKDQSQNFNEGGSNFSKDLKINNTDLAGVGARFNCLNEEENMILDETQNDLSQHRAICQNVQTGHSSSRIYKQLDKQYEDGFSHSKQNLQKWNISPPKNTKEEEDFDKTVTTYHLPKMKNPTRLTRESLPSNANISQLKDRLHLLGSTNCKNASKTLNSFEKSSDDINNQNNPGLYSEEVFLVPSTRIKRGSLAKTTNGSPPKVRRLSQDLKLKRLSTPMHRKMPLNIMSEGRKKSKAEVPQSLPRTTTSIKKRKSLKVYYK